MKVIIAGGRDFNDYDFLKSKVDKILSMRDNIEIVSGVANGADKLGELYAIEYNHKIKRFPADWGRFNRQAGYIRNIEMADYADALIVFWDGKSKGTKHMIDVAEEKNLLIRIIMY